MQVLFERGLEHGVETQGCGEWPGTVERLDAAVLPHMGWNTVSAAEGSRLLAGVEDERFYFVHSYGVLGLAARADAPDALSEGQLGRARQAVRRGGRERPAVGHPVPPREVRRRGRPAAAQLGRARL